MAVLLASHCPLLRRFALRYTLGHVLVDARALVSPPRCLPHVCPLTPAPRTRLGTQKKAPAKKAAKPAKKIAKKPAKKAAKPAKKAAKPKKEKKEKKDKKPRAPSKYNIFMKAEIAKVKKANPNFDHKTAFAKAASNWSAKK